MNHLEASGDGVLGQSECYQRIALLLAQRGGVNFHFLDTPQRAEKDFYVGEKLNVSTVHNHTWRCETGCSWQEWHCRSDRKTQKVSPNSSSLISVGKPLTYTLVGSWTVFGCALLPALAPALELLTLAAADVAGTGAAEPTPGHSLQNTHMRDKGQYHIE